MDEKIAEQQVPWYETNLFWGPAAIGVGIVLAVVAAMKHDLIWLLYFAAPCFIFAAWALLKRWLKRRQLVLSVVVAGVLICGAGYWTRVWLGKPDTEQVKKAAGNDTTVSHGAVDKTAPTEEKKGATTQEPATKQNNTTKQPARKREPQQRAALREKLPSQDAKVTAPSSSQAVPPPISQECAPGAYCAQSSGQSGGFTGQVIVTPKPPLPNINWSSAEIKPDEYPELKKGGGTTWGADPEAPEKQKLQKENPGRVITLSLDRSWSDAMFAAICNVPCKTIEAATVDGLSAIGELVPEPAPNIVVIGVQMPATLAANFPVKWEIRSLGKEPLTILKVTRAVHKEPN